MAHSELEWLATEALSREKIVEIGSYLGRSTNALGNNTRGVVYAVDNYQGVKDMNLPAAIRNNVWELFIYNTASLIESNKVIPVLADHSYVPLDISPDMVFIDGDHSYEAVKRDIQMWLPRLQRGGLLCGHDIQFTQVQKAVSESVGGYKIGKNTTIWFIIKE